MFKERYKKIYSDIKADSRLKEKTINACRNKGGVYMKKRLNKAVAAICACAVILVSGVNISPTFAAGIENIPILGTVSKIVSIRTYTEKNDDNTVNVDQPEVTGAVDINKEIENAIAQYKEEAQKSIDEYKEAFIATGGTEEEFAQKNINVVIDYEIKADNDKYISFVITMYEDWLASSARYIYYNLDAQTGDKLTLEDILGSDYINIANEIISDEITERGEEAGYFTDESGFKTISSDTDFYINDRGNPVIVFDKYEIASGYVGRPEFEIDASSAKKENTADPAGYSVEKKYDDANPNAAYPKITGYKGELLEDYMNQSLHSVIDKFSKEGYTDLKLDYEVTRMDDYILSVLYNGRVNLKNVGEVNITDSVNLDMAETGQEITVENYIKKDSMDDFRAILEKKSGIGDNKFEAEGLKMYFKDNEAVFYYTPMDDSRRDKVFIPVNLSELKGITENEFGKVYFS